jgi:hypothetical protein
MMMGHGREKAQKEPFRPTSEGSGLSASKNLEGVEGANEESMNAGKADNQTKPESSGSVPDFLPSSLKIRDQPDE